MRLTLRTMLAYLDGILEADDAQQLGKRIEESENATSILHRTQDVMRRLRLGAPSLTTSAPGLDANTVAEYLDNTMHDGRVPDFEKVCLESDVHLAEVASCHQVLTLVLGEPAEIDPAARQRMYRLVDLKHAVAEPTPPPPPGETAQPVSEPTEKGLPQKLTIPDYLRDPPKKRSFLPMAVALAVAACLVVIGLYGAGQFEPGTPFGDLLGFQSAEVADGQGPAAASSPSDPEVPGRPVDPATNEMPDRAEVGELAPDGTEQQAADASTVFPVTEAPKANPNADVEPPDAPLPDVAEVTESEPRDASIPDVAVPDAPVPDAPMPDVPTPDVVEPEAAETPQPENPNTSSPPPKDIGSLASKDQVLLKFDPEASVWQRTPFQGRLFSQQSLLALPTYRPKIALNSEVMLQLVDGTKLELLPPDRGTSGGVKMAYGQVIIAPRAKTPCRVRLQMGDRSGVLVLPDAQSIVGVQVISRRAPGGDPEAKPASAVAYVYPRTGNVFWEDAFGEETGAQQPLAIQEGQRLVVDDLPAQAPPEAATLPSWITSDGTSLLDRRASNMVEPALLSGRSVNLSLTELLDHRLQEVRWLAVCCLGHIGDFDPMVAALGDPSHKAAWPAWPHYVGQLKDAVDRGPEVAAQVRQAMQRQFGQDAAASYRMLWGYTLDTLKNGEAKNLVSYLDHNILALRVLSFINLEQMTGMRLYYEPEQTAAKRKQPIRSWNERLASEDFWAKLAERQQ